MIRMINLTLLSLLAALHALSAHKTGTYTSSRLLTYFPDVCMYHFTCTNSSPRVWQWLSNIWKMTSCFHWQKCRRKDLQHTSVDSHKVERVRVWRRHPDYRLEWPGRSQQVSLLDPQGPCCHWWGIHLHTQAHGAEHLLFQESVSLRIQVSLTSMQVHRYCCEREYLLDDQITLPEDNIDPSLTDDQAW
jgi:hypothetical protein